jgi:hypothetical protein
MSLGKIILHDGIIKANHIIEDVDSEVTTTTTTEPLLDPIYFVLGDVPQGN